MINWRQLGTDFQQKYEGCFCKYESPINKRREVFKILGVEVYDKKAPDMTLFNERAGELYLTYSTEAELDFSYPETGYFQGANMALMFNRRYKRQWKKGLCEATVFVESPYTQLYPYLGVHQFLDEKTIDRMFAQDHAVSISEAIKRIKKTPGMVSVPLNRHMCVGMSNRKEIYWIWYGYEPVAEVDSEKITITVKEFEQEVRDLIKSTGDYERTFI